MPKAKFQQNQSFVRAQLNEVAAIADEIHEKEKLLIQRLAAVDKKRFYVFYGFNSLTGFCQNGLSFSKTQTQRLVTQVRRCEPTANFGRNTQSDSYPQSETQPETPFETRSETQPKTQFEPRKE